MRTSVFLISVLNTSDPTMGQKGTFEPSSCAMASAMAVFPGEQMIQLRSPYAMSIDSNLSITMVLIDLEFGFRMSCDIGPNLCLAGPP